MAVGRGGYEVGGWEGGSWETWKTFQLRTAAAARAKNRIGTLIIQQPSFPLQLPLHQISRNLLIFSPNIGIGFFVGCIIALDWLVTDCIEPS